MINKHHIANGSGWLGLVLIHSATLPTIIKVLLGHSDVLPPLSMVLLCWLGLGMFLVSSVLNRQTLYTVSNSVGFIGQSVMLALIVLK